MLRLVNPEISAARTDHSFPRRRRVCGYRRAGETRVSPCLFPWLNRETKPVFEHSTRGIILPSCSGRAAGAILACRLPLASAIKQPREYRPVRARRASFPIPLQFRRDFMQMESGLYGNSSNNRKRAHSIHRRFDEVE